MKAIKTFYDGIEFRSRLEARWAVFFDNLHIKWRYEHEGFEFSNGTRYLPDFWLPTFNGGCFAEVKPTDLNDKELAKAMMLCIESKKEVLLLVDVPEMRCIQYFTPNDGMPILLCGLPNADQAAGENRMFQEPGYENDDLTISDKWHDCVGLHYVAAVQEAKSAKFEFLN